MKRLTILFAFALFLLIPTSVAAAECQFVLGFKTLRDLIGPETVGECLENEHHGANGDALQQTTGGLLVWRKADNWTAFTDGYRTWINGPNGLVQRLNTERFAWEADYAPGGVAAAPTVAHFPERATPPILTVSVTQAIDALPWIRDGLDNPSEHHAMSELRNLAAVAPQVFWAWIDMYAHDVRVVENLYVVSQISAVARSDVGAALEMLQTPFFRVDGSYADLRMIVLMADLESLRLGSLRQLLSHPELALDITDDYKTPFALLALGIMHPEAAAAIEALPWVQDGVDGREDETVHDNYHPTEHEREAVLHLVEIGMKSPQVLITLLGKSWVLDSNSSEEYSAFSEINELAAWEPDSTLQLVGMPFLETFEKGDYDILRNLSELRLANTISLGQIVSHAAFAGGITDEHVATVNLVILEALNPGVGDAFSNLSWIQDGVTPLEQNALNALHELAVRGTELLEFLAQKAWMQDGITFDEMFLLYKFGAMSRDDAIRIVNMPFLVSLHDTDFAALTSLVELHGFLGSGHFKQVLDHPTLRGGITDETAGLVAVLHNVSKYRPELLYVLLDPEQSIRERRAIWLPRGGETKLEVVRIHPGSPHTMDLLEEVVRFHEEFMLEAFPKRFLTALVFEDILGEAHGRGAITLGLDESYWLIAHEVAHSYWVSFPLWIAEGAATFMERVAVRAREGDPIRTYTKGDCSIADSLLAYEEYEIPPGEAFNRGCAYSLGGGMFADLYFALGDWEFRQGFRRLYVAIRDGTYADECNNKPTSGICHVGGAFVNYAPPEAAAIAGPIVHRWYYGSDPRGR